MLNAKNNTDLSLINEQFLAIIEENINVFCEENNVKIKTYEELCAVRV